MSRRITRSQTISSENTPVCTFTIFRKSTSTRKSARPSKPTANKPSQNKSASEDQRSEFKITKNVEGVPSSPLRKTSAVADGKPLSNNKLKSSAINLREKQKIVNQTPVLAITPRRMTRSCLLANAPDNINKRKDEPAKMGKHQPTPKKSIRKAQTTPPTSPADVIEVTPEISAASQRSQTATAIFADVVNVSAVDSQLEQIQTIASVSPLDLQVIPCRTPRRNSRLRSISLAKYPANIGSKKSLSTRQQIPKKSATNDLVTPPSSPTDVIEVTPTTSATTKKSQTATPRLADDVNVSEVDSLLEQIQPITSVSNLDLQAIPCRTPRRNSITQVTPEVNTAAKKKSATKAKTSKNLQPEEIQPITSASTPDLNLMDVTVEANASEAASISLRRSNRSTKGLTSKRIEEVAGKFDYLTLSTAKPSKTPRRRHTINPVQSRSDEIVDGASNVDQGTSIGVQSKVCGRHVSKKPDKSSTDMSANSTIPDENVASIEDLGNSGANSVTTATTGQQSDVIKRRTTVKPACRRSKSSGDSSANTNGIPVTSAKWKSKENETVFIKIPDDLRQILIDDSKLINTTKRLNKIPTDCNVAKVVNEYVSTNDPNAATDSWNSCPMTSNILFQGIIEYFDALIGRQLLYETERDQYESIMNDFPDMAMSTIYPPIYLLRLLVQLNKLICFKNTSDENIKLSVDRLDNFMKYLSDNKATLFNTSC